MKRQFRKPNRLASRRWNSWSEQELMLCSEILPQQVEHSALRHSSLACQQDGRPSQQRLQDLRAEARVAEVLRRSEVEERAQSLEEKTYPLLGTPPVSAVQIRSLRLLRYLSTSSGLDSICSILMSSESYTAHRRWPKNGSEQTRKSE